MTLNDIINQIDSFDDGDTIYAVQPWKPDSEAVVATECNDGRLADDVVNVNAAYFLEIFLAKEFLEDRLSNSVQKVSGNEQCLRLIQYVENDA
ncbi:hypothetical protein JHU04_004255 [Brenneria sp. 4F2]|nr:hypothetical protein [Brenneria bubanii]